MEPDPDRLGQTHWLIEQAQRGDRPALEELFARYLPVVRTIVAQRLGIRARQFADREDLLQDSLLHALKNLCRFEPRSEGCFRGWLATIVLNSVRSQSKRENAVKRGGGRVTPVSALRSSSMGASLFPGKGPSPSEVARFAEFEQQVEDALLGLSERDRAIIELRRFCQMSYREVGDELGIDNEDTVRSAFARALGRLATKLGATLTGRAPELDRESS